LRRGRYLLWLAAARLRHRLGRAALVALGVATGAGALAAVLSGSLVAQDRALAVNIQKLDPAERVLRVAWGGIPAQGSERFDALDRIARRAVTPLVGRPPFAALVYRETEIGGAVVDLGAVEGLRRWVRLRTGRLPRECRPSRCEVLQAGGTGALPSDPALHLVRVGSGTLTSDLPLGSDLGLRQNPAVESAQSYHSAVKLPILLAEGVSSLAQNPALQTIYRTYAWVAPLERGDVRPWSVGSFSSRVDQARSALESSSELFTLQAPEDELRAARDSSTAAGRRLLLIGGEAAALLLAFALLAASSASRDATAASRRLTWFGASRAQRLFVFGAEGLGIAVAGTAVGWAVGAAAAVALADVAGSPASAVLGHSILSRQGLVLAAALAAASALLLLGSLWPSRAQLGRLTITPVDVAALGALVAIALALLRGSADPEAIVQEQGTGVIFLLLPGLVAFVAAVVCVRALGPGLRLLERLARRSGMPIRLAALSLARNSGRSAIAVAFLVVSLGLAAFAVTYRSTLSHNQVDEAGYAVPLDLTLQEDFTQGVYPLEAAPLTRYPALGPGVGSYPIIRVGGDASGGGQSGTTILGVPSAALPRLHWRSDFADVPPAELARRLEPRTSVALRGLPVPAGTRVLLLPVRVRGDGLQLSAAVATKDGDFAFVDFGLVRKGGTTVLRGRVPEDAPGGLLVGFTLSLPTAGERGFTRESRGVLSLGRLRAIGPGGTRTLGSYRGWIGVNGVRPAAGPEGARLRYLVANALVSRFRPRQPTDGRPVPVVVSPNLARAAGPGGLLPVTIVDQQFLAKVVATARRFPTLGGSFVVADERWLSGALNGPVPRSGEVVEIWVDSGRSPARVERGLEQPPFDRLQLTSHRGVEAALRGDPLSRGVMITLAAAAIVALVLALAGLVLAVIGDLRDERGELYELEAQGAAPADLRRLLRLRTLVVAVVGLAGGLATGAVLSTLVVGVVRLTAGAETPQPPLRLDVDWTLFAAGLAGYAALAVLLVGTVVWSAFRAPVGRPAEATL
jgi:hypothetical protein